jgi:hypothetical protein
VLASAECTFLFVSFHELMWTLINHLSHAILFWVLNFLLHVCHNFHRLVKITTIFVDRCRSQYPCFLWFQLMIGVDMVSMFYNLVVYW